MSRLPRRVGWLAVALATVVALLAPAAVQANSLSTTILLGSKAFPSGAAVPGGLAGTIPVLKGSSVTLWAPAYLYKPATPPSTVATLYQFMFWDVNATLVTPEKAKFTAPTAVAAFKATAWYLPVCMDSAVPSSCTGGGTAAVTTWAFSLTSYKVLSGTPIGSVSPASAWTSPSTTVPMSAAVDITAASCFGVCTSTSWTVFRSWLAFGGAGIATSGLDLKVPTGESPYAIAFYRQGVHTPIPRGPCIAPLC